MNIYSKILFALLFTTIGTATQLAHAQEEENNNRLHIMTQLSYTHSNGEHAPYWLTALRQGVISTKEKSGYARLAATYNNRFGKNKNYSYRISADIIANHNHTSNLFIQQAYAELSRKWLRISLGSKERFGENRTDETLFNNTAFDTNRVNQYFPTLHKRQITSLSSGGLLYSGNSRPIPQIRAEVPEYTTIPWFNQWVQMRGHIAYGIFTDENFQEEFSRNCSFTRYAKNQLYHSKAVFIKIGKPRKFPLTFEGGLELYTQYGGNIYTHADGLVVSMPHSILDHIKAFIPMSGSEDTPIDEQTNISGNQIGNWHTAFTLHTKPVDVRIYSEHLFEDFSQLFFFEYQSNKEGKKRIIYYPWKDMMIGIRITNKSNYLKFISSIQYEYMSTYDQSGALYHDPSDNFNEQMDGVDNYYNHGIYPGWHHWGMGIGNPLVISPIYNESGELVFRSNRLISHTIGINGTLGNRIPLTYRLLYSYSEHWGTYLNPFREKKYITSTLGEFIYAPKNSKWLGALAVGYDNSNLIGNNLGATLTITRVFSINPNKKK